MTYSQPEKDLIDKILTIDGWLYVNEALALAQYAKNVHNCIVEIGSYRGRSTVLFGTFSPEGIPVYAIDPHIASTGERTPFGNIDRAIFSYNVNHWQLSAKVRPINLASSQVAKVWNEPIGLLFIDGDHSYECVKADLAGFIPHMAHDGVIACHDNNWHGVKQALAERNDLTLLNTVDLTNFYRVNQ